MGSGGGSYLWSTSRNTVWSLICADSDHWRPSDGQEYKAIVNDPSTATSTAWLMCCSFLKSSQETFTDTSFEAGEQANRQSEMATTAHVKISFEFTFRLIYVILPPGQLAGLQTAG